MARRHGRNARLYANITSGGTAEPIAFLKEWSIEFTTDQQDVTAFGDTGKVYVTGLPDVKGSFSGFFDDATAQTYTAAVDGIARKVYLYWDLTNSPNSNFQGTAFLDFSASAAVDGPLTMTGNLSAAGPWVKSG